MDVCIMCLVSVHILGLIIVSSAVTTGTEDLNPFGDGRDVLCLLLLFSVFLQHSRLGGRGFCFCETKDWGPTLHRLFTSPRLHANTNTCCFILNHPTHPHTSAYFSFPPSLQPLLGEVCEQREAGLFLPWMGLFSINEPPFFLWLAQKHTHRQSLLMWN